MLKIFCNQTYYGVVTDSTSECEIV